MANVGVIEYTVDADTAAILKAEAVVNKSLTKIAKDFDSADKAVNKFKSTQKSAGNTINSMGQVLDKNGKIVVSLTNQYRALASTASNSFNKLSTSVSKSAKGVNKGLSAMGRSSGQAGIQLQQFIGQVQGGQSPMLALSQQGADLGIVLGAPLAGAIIGITSSIIGLLLPALFKSKDKMKELEEIAKELGKTLKETADGTDVLSERILKLAKRSESLAKIEISKGIVNSEEQIKKSIEAITEAADKGGFNFRESYSKTFDAIRNSTTKTYDEILKSTTSFTGLLDKGLKGASLNEIGALERDTRELIKVFGLTQEQAIKLGVSVSNVFTDKSIISVKSLENVISDLNDQTGGANKKLVTLSSSLVPLFQKVFDGVDNVNLLRQAFTDLGAALKEGEKEVSKYDETIKGIEQSLKAQTIALEDGEEAAFRFATAQQLGLKVGEQIPANIDDQIDALFRLRKAQDDTKEQERSEAKLKREVSNIGVSPEEQLNKRFELENEKLRQAREIDFLTEQEFLSRKESLQEQHEEKLKGLREKSNKDAIINFQALENQVIGTFASIASGAQDGKEAIRGLAQSILTQMIGALIKMGITAAIGQTTAVTTGVATAGTLATAYATPAALASLASFGANAVPAAAGITSTVGLAQGLALAGGREHGGSVQAGKAYQVGENGKTEIFSSGGKNIMIPGDNGNVISNKDAFGGEQQVQMNVTIENNASNTNVQTKMSDDGKNLKVFINEIANQISNNQGAIPKALRASTDLNFRAGR